MDADVLPQLTEADLVTLGLVLQAAKTLRDELADAAGLPTSKVSEIVGAAG